VQKRKNKKMRKMYASSILHLVLVPLFAVALYAAFAASDEQGYDGNPHFSLDGLDSYQGWK
jgi:hypothetical protein